VRLGKTESKQILRIHATELSGMLHKLPYRLSSAKDKIRKYNISSPFLVFFVHKYENRVPWSSIRSPQDIDNFITSTLLPSLKSKIDPSSPGNHYVTVDDQWIDNEFQRDAGNPQIQQAYQIYQQNPEQAKKNLQDAINKPRERNFHAWWDYMTKENDVYRRTPSFAYCMLEPMIHSSTPQDKRNVSSADPMAIASLYTKINSTGGTQNFNVLKVYRQELAESELARSNPRMKDDRSGWIIIPSKSRDPENFEKNKEMLRDFSIPNGWCTASGLEDPYLSKGDFHLYLEEGSATVAIRCEGDRDIAEIQGPHHVRPLDKWETILAHVEEYDLGTTSQHFQEIQKAAEINKRYDEDQAYRSRYNDGLMNMFDPKNFSMLSSKNQKDLAPVVKPSVVAYFSQNPLEFDAYCPSIFKNDPEVLTTLKPAVIKYFTEHQRHFNTRCPAILKNDPEVLTALKQAMIRYFSGKPQDFDVYCPAILKNDPEVLTALKQGTIRYFSGKPQDFDVYCPAILKNDPEVLTAVKPAVIRYFSENPWHFNTNCPAILNNDPAVQAVLKPAVITYFSKNPVLFNYYCPTIFKNDQGVLDALKQALIRYLTKYPLDFDACCPEMLKNDPEVLADLKPAMIRYFSEIPWNFNYCPAIFKNDPEVLAALKRGTSKHNTQASSRKQFWNWYQRSLRELSATGSAKRIGNRYAPQHLLNGQRGSMRNDIE
jgi:hypothetical protein